MASFMHSDFSFSATGGGRMSLAPPPPQPAAVSQQQVACFPKLPTSEIVKCLAELGINISKDELLHPENHRETIRRMYEYLVEICLGVSRDELAQPAFAGLNSINYPELHEESIPHLNFLRAVMRMMEVSEINDFSLKDLVMPSAPRLNKHLSGIVNFVKFREEKLFLLNDLVTARDEYLSRLNEVSEKNDALNNRLSILRDQTKEEAEQIRGLETDCRSLDSAIADLIKQEQLLDKENAELNDRNKQLEVRIAESLEQVEDLSSIQRRLGGQVVTSPEKFRKQIIEVGQTLQHEQKDAKAAEKKCKELTNWLVNIDETQTEVTLALEAIEEVRGEVERQKALIAELDAQKQGIASLKTVLSELSQNSQQSQRQASRADEKLATLRRQAATRAEDAQTNIDELHKQLVEAEAFRLQVKAKVERVEGETARLEREMDAEQVEQDQEVADIKTSYHKLEKKVISHLQTLRKALETHSAISSRSPMNVA